MTTLRQSGFTLAELLISLLVLGVITAFFIPRILASSDHSAWRTTLKSRISLVSAAGNVARRQGALSNLQVRNYFRDNLQYLSLDESEWLYVFEDGSTMDETVGGGWTNANRMMIRLDANGTQPPNTTGQDQILLVFCVQEGTHCSLSELGKFTFEVPGATNLDYYQALFANP